jgi:hypothetical protein
METVLQSDTMHLEKEGKRAWVTFTRESHLAIGAYKSMIFFNWQN